MASAFKMTDVIKKYPDFQLGPLSLELEPGTVLGYIGANGSGKTTTMHCLMGFVIAESGKIEICGKNEHQSSSDWKSYVGYVGDKHTFYENWSAEKNLRFISKFYSNWSDNIVRNLSKRFDIPLNKKVKTLSTGNRVKLSLISALAYSPKLLLLDEPTSGIDPVIRSEILDVLFEILEKEENAIFYSTHILSDISRIADDLVFLENGKIKMQSPKDDLTENWRRISFRLSGEKFDLDEVSLRRVNGDSYILVSDNFIKTTAHLRELGAENIEESRMSIEEIAVQILKGVE